MRRPAADGPVSQGRTGLLVLLFLTTYAAVGGWNPYLGLFLSTRGFSGAAIGGTLALLPLASLLSAPVWAVIADRSRRGDRILQGVLAATVLASGVVLVARGPLLLALAVAAFAAARSSVGPLLDAQILRWLDQRHGRGEMYGRIRLFGSAGYLICGGLCAWAAEVSAAAPLWIGLVLWIAGLGLAFLLPASSPAPPSLVGPALRELGRQPVVAVVLAVTVVQGATLFLYDSLFAIHVTSLGHAVRWAGIAMVPGILLEIGVMIAAPQLLRRWPPTGLLLAGLVAAAIRWGLTAVVTAPVPLVAVQALHGLSFGAYWIGGVELLRQRAPEHIRASAQTLFFSCFWTGALLSAGLVAALMDLIGTRGLYALGAVLTTMATLALLQVVRRSVKPDPGLLATQRGGRRTRVRGLTTLPRTLR